MSPAARSRSISSRRSYSRSPPRRHSERRKSHRRYSRGVYESRSRSVSRQPPSPLTMAPVRHNSIRFSGNSNSSSRSQSNQRRRTSRSHTRSRSRSSHRVSEQLRSMREKPTASRCIGVFGLSVFTTQQQIREIFGKYGPIERIQVVIDAQTGRSRGFCFIYYDEMNDAKTAKDACSGMEVDGRRIRVDYSITKRAHTPTPGVYMGQPTRVYRKREYHDRYRDEYRVRRQSSPSSPPRSSSSFQRTRRRSHSRSYTPPPRRSHY